MKMVILASVFVVGERLLEPCWIGERVMPQLHGDGLPGDNLSKEDVERGGHGKADTVEDNVGFALDGIVNAKVDLYCRGRSFHAEYYSIYFGRLYSGMLAICYKKRLRGRKGAMTELTYPSQKLKRSYPLNLLRERHQHRRCGMVVGGSFSLWKCRFANARLTANGGHSAN